MKKIAVILSGCGFKDGAEVTESVSTLITLSELGTQYTVFAPEKSFTATNHITGQAEGQRQLINEASRISRGNIENLKNLKVDDFDAVVFPGGYGVAQHLCTWATEGSHCSVMPEAEKIITAFHAQSKPIGALCIAPALIAKVLGDKNITVTIGNDKETAQEIEKTGAQHEDCAVDDYVTDREAKIITTPAYMYEAQPHQVFIGIKKALTELVEMA